MSSSSGGVPRTGQKPNTSKLKTSLSINHDPDSDWLTQTSKKSRKSTLKASSPVSPSLQQIISNPPLLITNDTAFNYNNNNLLSPSDNASTAMLTDCNVNASNTVDSIPVSPIPSTTADNHSTSFSPANMDYQHINHYNSQNSPLRLFSHDYSGPVIILVECVDPSKNLGNWHPLKAAKFFSANFKGIINIKPASSNKIKITFNSVTNGNLCLNSNILSINGFTATIPSTLIYSFGIIKIDNSFSEEDFRDGLQSSVPVVTFKRISVKKDGATIQTRIVELKFAAPKIPSHISIYNMLFDVQPSIRSPVQCNRCLRFGHTQKFCRSKPRCSHCSGDDHSFNVCPSAPTTDPICIFCSLPHLATDRSCREWLFQKEIKKIMATENLSYREALDFKKNNYLTSAFKYSEIVNRQSPPVENTSVPTSLSNADFPNLNTSHHFFNSGKKKIKTRPPSHLKSFTLPHESPLPLPNGSYLNSHTQNSQSLVQSLNDFSWVHLLSLKLSESLINSPTLLSPFSSSTLQNLIESSLHSLLSIPKLSIIS